jgi:hypothetical protein
MDAVEYVAVTVLGLLIVLWAYVARDLKRIADSLAYIAYAYSVECRKRRRREEAE